MIAPLRDPQVDGSKRQMLRARMAVASALLPPKPRTSNDPPLARWRAWIWTAWITLVAVAFTAQLIADFIGAR